MLDSLLPEEVERNKTINDIRLKSNLTTTKTTRFTEKSSYYVILRFTQSHSGELGNFEGFVQLIPGSHKSDNPINITAINKIHLKSDCIDGSIINGIRENILYSFALG